ncbi:tetratricopeptide repeat protein [Oscillatoriales cyanobacterium LEGE 11467]|uniref:Tetratricopeptide repeat protein n=1 Tax=Zarconia navalis LEGE 11467 TaxID=1828826 RepID=A0A928VUM6_9CYAN|nr:tetratricopeptide repeat protein [Zarconia navalis]MBE9039618.1 tetratricopeptide repeat protein [Zarconia navalis LEGE 11467]
MSLKVESQTAQSFREKGDELKSNGQFALAIEQYEKALNLDPKLVPVLRELGEIHKNLGQLDEAISCYEKAISCKPQNAGLYARLGDILKKRGHLEEAISHYLKAIQTDPSFLLPYRRLKYARIKPSQFDEAIACYRHAIENHPQASLNSYIRLGDLLTKQGHLEEAIDCYKNASYQRNLASHPDFVQKYWNSKQLGQPNFIIIGVGKCGTTALSNYLDKHPKVLPSVEKELHFFNRDFAYGKKWYKSHFPPIPKKRSEFVTGEATPWYFNTLGVEERIFKLFPNIKLILILRNPIDRALSQYNMHIEQGRNLHSFEEEMRAEMKELKDILSSSDPKLDRTKLEKGCLGRGIYIYFLEKWMSLFPQEQLLILKSENLKNEPALTMMNVFEFLGLSDHPTLEYKKHNSRSYSPMSNDLRETLSNFFKPYNQKLEDYTNTEFNWK